MEVGMLRLHGYPVSNYFNIVRAALIEKAVDFQIELTRASQDPAFLSHSPMGKIPVLETDEGWLSETVAILEYLEDRVATPALQPSNRFGRAKGRQIINIVQMYVESPVRTLFPGVFFGRSNDVSTQEEARRILDRATEALARLMIPEPYLLGPSLSYADLFAFYCLEIADRVTRFVYARSIVSEIGGLADWWRRIAARESTLVVLADFHPAFRAYLQTNAAAYRESSESNGAGQVVHSE